MARVRKADNNDIFIVMPAPKKLIENSPKAIQIGGYLLRTVKVPDFKRLKKSNFKMGK